MSFAEKDWVHVTWPGCAQRFGVLISVVTIFDLLQGKNQTDADLLRVCFF